MNKKMKKDVKLSPSAIIAVGFLLLILTATLLLMLPISAQNRQSTPLLTSLFTATSAVCVTGQALVDTGTHWSLFGQVVLIVAIQIGGLGVMTLMALVSMALGKRIGLRQRTLLQESVASFQVGGIVRLVRFAMRGTAVVEGCGAVLLSFRFVPMLGWAKGIWYGVFHPIITLSVGYCTGAGGFLRVNKMMNVMLPSLPAYISIMMTMRENVFKSRVMPVVKPTVSMAEKTSISTC